MFKGNLYGKAERMEKIYSRIVRIVSIIIIGYLFLQGLFTICNMQRVTEQVYYMKNNPWRQLLCIGIVVLLCLAARKCKVKEFLDRYGHYVFYVCITGMVLFLLWWVSQTGFWFFGDSEKIYMCDYCGAVSDLLSAVREKCFYSSTGSDHFNVSALCFSDQ